MEIYLGSNPQEASVKTYEVATKLGAARTTFM